MGSIAKGVFGVDAKTFEKAESEFAINANKIQFRFNLGSILRAMVVILAPRLAQFFGLRVIERSEYFPTLVRSAIRFREEQDQEVKEKSNDFLSILLDLKEEANKKESLDQRDSSDGSDDDDTQFEKDAELKGITKKAHIDESMIEQVCSFSRFQLNENAIFFFLNFACRMPSSSCWPASTLPRRPSPSSPTTWPSTRRCRRGRGRRWTRWQRRWTTML